MVGNVDTSGVGNVSLREITTGLLVRFPFCMVIDHARERVFGEPWIPNFHSAGYMTCAEAGVVFRRVRIASG